MALAEVLGSRCMHGSPCMRMQLAKAPLLLSVSSCMKPISFKEHASAPCIQMVPNQLGRLSEGWPIFISHHTLGLRDL